METTPLPNACFFFVEQTPIHGDLIFFGPTQSENEASLLASEGTNFGRWDDTHGVIITPELRTFSLNGRRGYCWQLTNRRLMSAEIYPADR
jgi:hypothetical protein